MIKTMKIDTLRKNGMDFINLWNEEKKDVTLSVKSMYALMKLKRGFETEFDKMNEMLKLIAEKHGATIQQDGSFQFPQDQVEAANKELQDFALTDIDFEYTPIKIDDDSFLPPDMFDALFDFLDVED